MAGPNAPGIAYISQTTSGAGDIVIVGVSQAPVTGSYPISNYILYRAPTTGGPWTQVDSEFISAVTINTPCFDNAPVIGQQFFYAAESIDSSGGVSSLSPIIPYTPYGAVITGVSLSSAAFGPNPLLGSDVLVDPTTGEGIVGPNGDFLGVNGLNCLAQDLRIRILCDPGVLVMHQDFGMIKDLIGAGQAGQATQAQKLRTRFINTILRDARVLSIQSISVSQATEDAWGVSMDIIAIGNEDPQHLNLVYPFYISGSSALPVGPYVA